ncbi:hypothetical protein EOD41_12395 [Mucilaginibacter limnophilus]|uniref:Uncharacterized protein n=1 Tax=Mucilaginibacter limnophilus TaxID=1932778 RepID=A0A3S2V7B1_9SPHI|nr:hypothetical protein [Mucilaginibacter limnophilus]RVU00277.1 hypothetical protein EOD41_12395 [Mucilaginibacter limnophilus]
MELENYKTHILLLAQKWRLQMLTPEELQELHNWYRSLEDTDLEAPLEMSVDRVEKLLHRLFSNNDRLKADDDSACPPYPL